MTPNLSNCWAKTNSEGQPALTVRDHCLIVGKVGAEAELLLPQAIRRLLPHGGVTLAAAHDIGKITPGFLQKCEAWRGAFKINGAQDCEGNHALMSQVYLASLREMADERGRPSEWRISVGGHHGKYNPSRAKNPKEREANLEWPTNLRNELLKELVSLFGEMPTLPITKGANLHWMTGFITFCDWIGSNTDWFPLSPSTTLKDSYTPEEAERLAKKALEEIGWHRRSIKKGLSFSRLFSTGETFEPRPLQETLMALAEEPGLYIVEAPMGMGKTEASLALAYKRWTEGDERGLYFALPTQLTSNRIHERVYDFLKRVVADETTQILAHGNAWLREDRLRAFSPATTTFEEIDAKEACQWFAADRKPLLAPFGTGTIDQAIMACISAKHSALRLFALSGKVIVIDEVHSYDPYTSALVDQLVCWLREVGCTVVVLSATLTAKRRQQLVKKAGGEECSPPESYPLITRVTEKETSYHPVEDIALKKTCVTLVHRDENDASLLKEIARAAEQGACVLVICNTVKRAQERFKTLKAEVKGEITMGLLHSRFPHFQRQENEGKWMEKLGKGSASRPQGCILVATQVVEQSVDIDADLLVTDLAPTDLLLQRIGRLHRHDRARPKGFENAVCWILYPQVDWEAEGDEIRKQIGTPAFVYPPVTFYLAEQVWKKRTTLELPNQIRMLLEEEASLEEGHLPAGAEYLRKKWRKKTENMLEKALRQGPFMAAALDDEEGAQTRYNISPSASLVLLKEKPSTRNGVTTINPLRGGEQKIQNGVFCYELAKSLQENVVRIPRYIVNKSLRETPSWLNQHMSDAVLAITDEDSTTLELLGECNYKLSYHSEQGISYVKLDRMAKLKDDTEEEDSWY